MGRGWLLAHDLDVAEHVLVGAEDGFLAAGRRHVAEDDLFRDVVGELLDVLRPGVVAVEHREDVRAAVVLRMVRVVDLKSVEE